MLVSFSELNYFQIRMVKKDDFGSNFNNNQNFLGRLKDLYGCNKRKNQ